MQKIKEMFCLSKLISIKAIIVKDSETCSNDFIMGVLRGLDISEDNIKLGVGDIKVELKDKNFGDILNIYTRLKKNFNCFCIKVFWNDGMMETIEYFVNRKFSEDNDDTLEKVGMLENQIRKIQKGLNEIKINKQE